MMWEKTLRGHLNRCRKRPRGAIEIDAGKDPAGPSKLMWEKTLRGHLNRCRKRPCGAIKIDVGKDPAGPSNWMLGALWAWATGGP